MRAPISTLGPWPGVRVAVPAGTIGQEVRSNRPSSFFGNEARPGGIEMAIALCVLAVNEEPLRHDQMKVIFCAGHGDVE